jgi:hypothetical protein
VGRAESRGRVLRRQAAPGRAFTPGAAFTPGLTRTAGFTRPLTVTIFAFPDGGFARTAGALAAVRTTACEPALRAPPCFPCP